MTDPKPMDAMKVLLSRMSHTLHHENRGVLCPKCELSALLPKLEQHIQAAVEAEREACAKVIDDVVSEIQRRIDDYISKQEQAGYREAAESWENFKLQAIKLATAIRSRGSSDALKEMLSEQENDVDGFWIDLVEEAIHVGIIPETKEAAIEAIKYALAEARKQGRLELEQALIRQMCEACRDGDEPRRADNTWLHDRVDLNGNPGPPFLCGATTLRDHIAGLKEP